MRWPLPGWKRSPHPALRKMIVRPGPFWQPSRGLSCLPFLALALGNFGCAGLKVHTPDQPPLAASSLQVYAMPKALVSNPSALTFGGWLPDGRAQLYTVLDGSALSKDHFAPEKLVLELKVNLNPGDSSLPPIEVLPLQLDPAARPCDLESIEVDPRDGTLLVADERVAGLASCGGTGPKGAAQTQVFRISRTGALLGGPWPMEVVNTQNNGIEAIAARAEADGTHLYVFKEWQTPGCPYAVDYRLAADPAAAPTLVRRFELDCGTTQTAADFYKPSGALLVVDRDARTLKRFDLDQRTKGTPLEQSSSRYDLNALLELVTGGVYHRSAPKELRRGMVEGLTSDDKGGLYLMLDNNGDAFPQGDNRPRMVYLKPLSELKNQ